MRHFLLCALFLSTTVALTAQSRIIDNFIEKYRGVESVTHVNLSGNLLNFIIEESDEDGEHNFMSRLDALRVISFEDASAVNADDVSALKQGIQANDYEELVRVRDGKELVQIYLSENKDKVIEELIILVQEPEEFTLVSLTGALRYEDLQKLELDDDADEALENLPDRGQPRP
ncbi:MAG: DUF4252 domain-containing protein [Bacteroidota bacterium]